MLGSIINKISDKFFPDIVGDIAGTVVDVYTGDYVGAAKNALDAMEDVAEAVDDNEPAYTSSGGYAIADGYDQLEPVEDSFPDGYDQLE